MVTCRGGLAAAGRQVIVALSPTLAGRIMYDPRPGLHIRYWVRAQRKHSYQAAGHQDKPSYQRQLRTLTRGAAGN